MHSLFLTGETIFEINFSPGDVNYDVIVTSYMLTERTKISTILDRTLKKLKKERMANSSSMKKMQMSRLAYYLVLLEWRQFIAPTKNIYILWWIGLLYMKKLKYVIVETTCNIGLYIPPFWTSSLRTIQIRLTHWTPFFFSFFFFFWFTGIDIGLNIQNKLLISAPCLLCVCGHGVVTRWRPFLLVWRMSDQVYIWITWSWMILI